MCTARRQRRLLRHPLWPSGRMAPPPAAPCTLMRTYMRGRPCAHMRELTTTRARARHRRHLHRRPVVPAMAVRNTARARTRAWSRPCATPGLTPRAAPTPPAGVAAAASPPTAAAAAAVARVEAAAAARVEAAAAAARVEAAAAAEEADAPLRAQAPRTLRRSCRTPRVLLPLQPPRSRRALPASSVSDKRPYNQERGSLQQGALKSVDLSRVCSRVWTASAGCAQECGHSQPGKGENCPPKTFELNATRVSLRRRASGMLSRPSLAV
eukprot:252817-Chlamydomonas_euryale.AAC.1